MNNKCCNNDNQLKYGYRSAKKKMKRRACLQLISKLSIRLGIVGLGTNSMASSILSKTNNNPAYKPSNKTTSENLTKKIIVVSSFECPWCWLAHEVILRLNNKNYQFHWQPHVLRAYVGEKGEDFWDSTDRMANWTDEEIDAYVNSPMMIKNAKLLGIEWKRRTHRYNAINASIFALFADTKGLLEPFVTATFRQYFLADDPDDRNIARISILEDIAKRIGLDPPDVRKVVTSQKYRTLFNQRIEKYSRVSSIPTFIYGDKMDTGFIPMDDFPTFLEKLTN